MTHIDRDLEFLRRCPNAELQKLCDYLTFDSDGTYRISEELSDTDAYIRNYPDNMKGMMDEVANELLKFGSNSIMTFINDGRPDSYEDVVRRVCKKMKVDISERDDTVEMEHHLLQHICETALSNMSDEDIDDLAEEIGLMKKNINKQLMISGLLMAMKRYPQVFYRVVSYVVTRVLAFLGGRAAAVTGAQVLQRIFGIATGPIGWIAMTAWTLWDIAAPAYRVIIPAVMHVAVMRYTYTPHLAYWRVA